MDGGSTAGGEISQIHVQRHDPRPRRPAQALVVLLDVADPRGQARRVETKTLVVAVGPDRPARAQVVAGRVLGAWPSAKPVATVRIHWLFPAEGLPETKAWPTASSTAAGIPCGCDRATSGSI